MTTAMPSNVNFGKIVHRMIQVVADGSDPDGYPDAMPIAGATILFTPTVDRVLDATAVPPVTIYPKPIECTTDADGLLHDPAGNLGVWLVATDDPDLNPTNWTYTVEVRIPNGPTRTFPCTVPGGTTTDLTLVMGVPSSDGIPTVIGPPGPSAYATAVANGFVGDETAWLASLVGAAGRTRRTGAVRHPAERRGLLLHPWA